MPLPVPRLDDRTFADLVREGEDLIPRYGGDWTDRNPSDPGVTLVELFAWLTETAIYQIDRVPPETIEAFVRLLGQSRRVNPDGSREEVESALSRSVRSLGDRSRAVTAAEFEAIALDTAVEGSPRVARAHFLRLTEETCRTPDELAALRAARLAAGARGVAPSGGGGEGGEDVVGVEAAAVVIVPDDRVSERPSPRPELVHAVFRRLNERRILGTRVRVFGAVYVPVEVRTQVARRRGSGLTRERVQAEVARFLSPLDGGADGTGWPFGRPVYLSELYQLLEGMPGVDHVESLKLSGPAAGRGGASDEALAPYVLPDAPRARIDVTVVEVR